jgi:hypothetical protein
MVEKATKSEAPSANSHQVAGDHYQKMTIQHWDVAALMGMDYWQGQITKYVMRWRDKNGIIDLKKARHFLDKYIELQELLKDGKPAMVRALLIQALDKAAPPAPKEFDPTGAEASDSDAKGETA